MGKQSDSGRPKRGWVKKFADAFRGIAWGMHGQSSFAIHLTATAGVVAAGFYVGVSPSQWCLLATSITVVLTAELFNSAIELLAKAVEPGHNEQLGRALDIASGAVLVAAIGSMVVGGIVFVPYFL